MEDASNNQNSKPTSAGGADARDDGKPQPQASHLIADVDLPLSPSGNIKTHRDWLEYLKFAVEIIGLGLLITYTIYAGLQWHEMRKATKATQDAATAAKDSADVAKEIMHVDQRAWMNIVVGQVLLENGSPIRMPIRIVNAGKTPAYKVEGVMVISLLKESEQPDFNYSNGVHPKYSVNGGTSLPNIPADFSWAVLPSFVPQNKPIDPIITNEQIKSGMQSGSLYIVVYGKITYDDVFGISHWLQYCSYAHNSIGAPEKATADLCGPYNDADKNSERDAPRPR